MKVLVCGDRNWSDFSAIITTLKKLTTPGDIVIEGEAKGADKLARKAAESLGLEVIPVPADWTQYGRAAGPIRNKAMLALQPDLVLAFHNNIGESKGTANMMQQARKAGVRTILYTSSGVAT